MSSITPAQETGNFLIPASRVSSPNTVQTTGRTQIAASVQTTTITATSTVNGTPVTVDGPTATIIASKSPSQPSSTGKLPAKAIAGLSVGLVAFLVIAAVVLLLFRRNLQKKQSAVAQERKLLALEGKELENLRLGRVKGDEAIISPYTEDTSSTLWDQRTYRTAKRDLERSEDRPLPVKSIFKNPANRLLKPLPSVKEDDDDSIISERKEDVAARIEAEQRRRELRKQDARENRVLEKWKGKGKARFDEPFASPVSWTSNQATIVPSPKTGTDMNSSFQGEASTSTQSQRTSSNERKKTEQDSSKNTSSETSVYPNLRPDVFVDAKNRRHQAAREEEHRQQTILAPSSAQIEADRLHRERHRFEGLELPRMNESGHLEAWTDRTSRRRPAVQTTRSSPFQLASSGVQEMSASAEHGDGDGRRWESVPDIEISLTGLVSSEPDTCTSDNDIVDEAHSSDPRASSKGRYDAAAAVPKPVSTITDAEAEAEMLIADARARSSGRLVVDPRLGIDKISGVTSYASSGAFAAYRTDEDDLSTTEITIGRDPFRQEEIDRGFMK